MKIEVLDSLEPLRHEWTELCRRSAATPFQSPQWLIPWTRHLFGGGEIWIVAMRDGGKLVGIAPLFRWGAHERRVSFLGAGVSDYGGLVCAPGLERECARALCDFLISQERRWDILDLREIREGSALLEEFAAEPCSVCPILRLSDYPAAMDHKHRADLRRVQNKLRRGYRAELIETDESNFNEQIERFFALHEARWGTLETRIRTFQRDAGYELLNSGMFRLYVLCAGGTPAAAIYAFASGSVLYCYLSGYEPSLAKFSPGAVLMAWVIEQAAREGHAEVNFLRHPEPYKYLWGARDRTNYRILFQC